LEAGAVEDAAGTVVVAGAGDTYLASSVSRSGMFAGFMVEAAVKVRVERGKLHLAGGSSI
jgi:hypothetical protein